MPPEEQTEKIHQMELNQVGMAKDLKHIKERIDNGMSKTITAIWNKMNADVMPAIEDSKFWLGWIKKGMAIVMLAGIARLGWAFVEKIIHVG